MTELFDRVFILERERVQGLLIDTVLSIYNKCNINVCQKPVVSMEATVRVAEFSGDNEHYVCQYLLGNNIFVDTHPVFLGNILLSRSDCIVKRSTLQLTGL